MAHKDFSSSLITRLSVVRLSIVVFSGFAIYLEIATDVGVYIGRLYCSKAGVKDMEVMRAWRELRCAVTVMIVEEDAEDCHELMVVLAKASVIHFRFL